MADGHLVGSMNLDNGEQVFRTGSEQAGDAIARIPTEKTGSRKGWIFHEVSRGARRRSATAARHITDLGVACDCGMQNKPRDSMEPLPALHRNLDVPA